MNKIQKQLEEFEKKFFIKSGSLTVEEYLELENLFKQTILITAEEVLRESEIEGWQGLDNQTWKVIEQQQKVKHSQILSTLKHNIEL